MSSPEVYAAALSALRGLGPQRLRSLLAHREPQDAWNMIRAGRYPADRSAPNDLTTKLRDEAHRVDPDAVADLIAEHSVQVFRLGQLNYPPALADDFAAPAVLFASGNVGALDRRRVGMVGTRRATAAGRSIATELGFELARNGVAVVSGLALGIDGAAHRGALSCTERAMPIAVVASGIDMPYPLRHTDLWNEVRERGLVLSEVPPGTPPLSWRFPLRNRIIAALSEVLVVVESHERGGSLITAEEALDRERLVMAVPGSPRNFAALGTNQLLRDGASPIQDVRDVLMALGLGQLQFSTPAADPRRAPSAEDTVVRDAFGDVPVLPEDLANAVAQPFLDVALSLARLEVGGWVVRSGAFFERVPFALAPRPVP
jgi:DNA processing protein